MDDKLRQMIVDICLAIKQPEKAVKQLAKIGVHTTKDEFVKNEADFLQDLVTYPEKYLDYDQWAYKQYIYGSQGYYGQKIEY